MLMQVTAGDGAASEAARMKYKNQWRHNTFLHGFVPGLESSHGDGDRYGHLRALPFAFLILLRRQFHHMRRHKVRARSEPQLKQLIPANLHGKLIAFMAIRNGR